MLGHHLVQRPSEGPEPRDEDVVDGLCIFFVSCVCRVCVNKYVYIIYYMIYTIHAMRVWVWVWVWVCRGVRDEDIVDGLDIVSFCFQTSKSNGAWACWWWIDVGYDGGSNHPHICA